MIEMIIPGIVVAQGRPRFARRGGFVQTYDPPKSKEYKELIKTYAHKVKPKEPLTQALSIEIDVYREIPKSWSKKKKEDATNGTLLPTVKSDVDNYAKGIMDAISGIIYEDDKQVCELKVTKKYSNDPRAEVKIRNLEESK